MKDVELKLVSELLKGSRRSDRELARALGVSQPTVSRTLKKLDKEGYTKEYTIIPDFKKLGYHLCCLTFCRSAETPTSEKIKKAVEVARERLHEIPQAVLIERGIGLDSNGVVISLHRDYSSYVKFKNWLQQFSFLGTYELQNFMIDLDNDVHYRYLTFAILAKELQKNKEKDEEANKR
jgi:DNA-binding Lrp family transcriptional regulator